MFPEMRLQGFKGQGTEQDKGDRELFDYGFKTEKGRKRVVVSYKMEQGEKTFQDLINGINAFVPDISFNEFCYMEKNLRLGPNQPTSVLCMWNRESIQTNKLQKMIVDGSKPDYPNRDLVTMMNEFKKVLGELPEAQRARFRPSFMTLQTKPDINDDEYAIKALKQPYMLFIKERNKPWIIGDWEYKTKG